MNKLGLYVFACVVGLGSFCFADKKGVESPLGPVVAVERKFILDSVDCGTSFKKNYTGDNKEYIQLSCEVAVFPYSDEEAPISSSLDVDYDNRRALLTELRGTKIWINVDSMLNGYEIETAGWSKNYHPELEKITKEDFLKAAQQLFDKFPEMTVKLIKVVR